MTNQAFIPNPDALPLQDIEGTLERITFQNESNGYTVGHLKSEGQRDEITIIGNLAGVSAGSQVHLRGLWVNHPQYGRQFEVRSYTILVPATVEGIQKYLGSGLIKGIGPVTATHIVQTFGLETLDVIEKAPQRLLEVPGLGEKRITWITQAWEAQKQIKEIMIFLQSQGVSSNLATKIYKQYGDAAISVVKREPYRLAKDIYGIGFKTADKIAMKLGITPDAPARIQAGLLNAESTFIDEGHCFAKRAELIAAASKLLDLPPEACTAQVELLIHQGDLLAEDDALYLPPFLYAEQGVANRIHLIATSTRDRLSVFRDTDWDKAFAWLDEANLNLHQDIHLTDSQKAAIRMAATQKVSVLTGGPGTGKSTIMGSLIHLLEAKKCSVLLAAPTGRAAKRLSETTGMQAKTIHRLLEYKPENKTLFQRDRENPLDADLIIIDESSMVDILLMYHLLNAIESGSHLLLVGDIDQLPSVGAGNVLHDLIASDTLPVTRLDTIFRQAEGSFIIVNSHRINQGQAPIISPDSKDFFLFSAADPEKAADWVVDLVTNRIPNKFGFKSDEDIQVLCPMHRGAAGVTNLNERLQLALNPPSKSKLELHHGQRIFREGDRIMQIRNNYDLQVFNGDLGKLKKINLEDQTVLTEFDGRLIEYDFAQMEELVHAYAASIHKAQGSEFPVVVIPLLTQHYMMLQRNLLYTGVTRAKKMVVLVGTRRAIEIAVKNHSTSLRNTHLVDRLKHPPTASQTASPYQVS